jgi:hypothetical protein
MAEISNVDARTLVSFLMTAAVCIVGEIRSISTLLVYHMQFGWTPLHFACGNGHREVADLLLKAGADIEAKDKVIILCMSIGEHMTRGNIDSSSCSRTRDTIFISLMIGRLASTSAASM